jgi:hypothetical protein
MHNCASEQDASIWKLVSAWVALLPLLFISVSGRVDLGSILNAPINTHPMAEVL